jgi:uncharacterized membrane protein YhaH (DUF805 family)
MFCRSLFGLVVLLLCTIALAALRFTDFDCPFGIIKLFAFPLPFFGHCIVSPSIYRFFKLFFVLVVNIAGMKYCSLEAKQQSITILSSVEHPFHI